MRNRNSKILWLIPARAGSKSLPGKNVTNLSGLPLFAYRINTALSISDSEDVWFSTDSLQYAELARTYGVTVPFIRPAELSTDDANSSDVVLHAMQFAKENGFEYEFIGLLEPTSPFIYREDILKALNQLDSNPNANAIVAVKEVRPHSYFTQPSNEYLDQLSGKLAALKLHKRQQFQAEVTPSGGFYISRWEAFLNDKTFYSDFTLMYLVPPECEVEIDDPIDWKWAEFLIAQKIIDLKKIFN